MKLYERDYYSLTKLELRTIERLKLNDTGAKTMSAKKLLSIPKAYYFHSSFFPNNMLDTDDLEPSLATEHINRFSEIINNPAVSERDVQSFVIQNRAFFTVASVLAYYDFGHHGAFLFPEFPLSNNYVADYLIIGRNSGGHEFIFVELESIQGKITKKDGSLGECFRKGIKQIEDWELWLEKHYSTLKPFFDKYRNTSKALPDEFFEYDKSRIHFVVVAGRRKDFTERTYRKRRKLLQETNLRLLHYDNLIDSSRAVTESKNYCRCI